MAKPMRKVKVGRSKTEAVNLRVTPKLKQDFYDIADVKGITLTALFEEMVADYKKRCLNGRE